ncbi:MAG: histidine kinase dimerization/phospho-acceptor domain-containing protein [Peptococcaceae bacterium]
MDIRWKNYSHSPVIKGIVFIIALVCFTGGITVFLNNIVVLNQGDLGAAFEKNYYLSRDYQRESSQVLDPLTTLMEFKSEEHILNGESITEEEIKREKESLFRQFEYNYQEGYNDGLSSAENYRKFEEVYADKIARIKDTLIAEDLKTYNDALRKLETVQGVLYYGGVGENVFTNIPGPEKDFFKSYPSYLIFDKAEETVYPAEIRENSYYYWIEQDINRMIRSTNIELNGDKPTQQNRALYIAFSEEFLNQRIEDWQNDKDFITLSLYKILAFAAGLAAAFLYLIIVIGRKSLGSKEIRLNIIDRLYNDFNMLLCFSLILLWCGVVSFIFDTRLYQAVLPSTLLIGAPGLILVLSLVKHIKNKTFIKHTLVYIIFSKIFNFLKEIYNSGSVGIKVILIIVGYPLIVALTFFIFPITVGIAGWLALKKVREFQAVKDGVAKVKEGDLHNKINVAGSGEFARLAGDINSITEGLQKAVASELKSERLKTELITNVSHDIRTPLTSIITYVDLLRNEEDPEKAAEYLDIIDQKSQRLKVLTADLFEAAKASSGNIPVNYEKIDLVSLITQGLGEVDDKVREQKLDFKVNYPRDKVYVTADGKLLWRAIENLLSNIFKYALQGSRVYLDVEDRGPEVNLIIKNISAYELNISAEELLERFKRGDESRSSQGSGLGLSIAKSLIEIQKGSFNLEIDGDLFKVIIKMPK